MTMPTFGEYFVAVHGHPPFPWQRRLAERVLADGWPELLDIPTGAGKTSALDVALYALAVDPARTPRRIVLVVDRRIVVDQGADHARRIRRQLIAGASEASRAIAQRLRDIWRAEPADPPFTIAVLRGGAPRDDDWAKRPDQPMIGLSTVDQIGSRLLFRGYGVNPRSASIHAGLMGNDTLILLDEVHLAVPFAETLDVIRRRYRRSIDGLPDRFHVVQMSATPGNAPHTSARLGLGDDDHAHPVLAQRLGASKPARLVSVSVRGSDEQAKRRALAEASIKEALALQDTGARVIGIVVNRVDTARVAWELLAASAARTDRLLVTGRMRAIDRDHLVQTELLPRCGATRVRRDDDRPLIVVATQCIEAGADLDFDGLVSECASLDALKQRFGRLDRRGSWSSAHQAANAVILCRADLAGERERDPVYGTALAATWAWLNEVAKGASVDFGIRSLPDACTPNGEPRLDLLAPSQRAPVLMPRHVEAWCHTSPLLRPEPDPDPSLWLHGPERSSADVQIIWRVDVSAPSGDEADVDDTTRAMLALVRPAALEALTIPLHAARAWLAETEDTVGISDTVVESDVDAVSTTGRSPRRALVIGGDRPTWVAADALRAGHVIVVPAAYGGLNAVGTFDPSATDAVVDVSDLAQQRARGRVVARLDRDQLDRWRLDVDDVPQPDEEETGVEARSRIRLWAKGLPAAPPDGYRGTPLDWSILRRGLVGLRRSPQVVGGRFVVVESIPADDTASGDAVDRVGEAVTEDDGSSFTATEVTLRQHSEDVRGLAEQYARSVGFSEEIVADIRHAAWLHDIGKSDPRFQRWLVGGSEVRAALLDEPLAKSALPTENAASRELSRRRSGYPSGERHELLSVALAQADPLSLDAAHDRDLVLHLIASHHGWCRPFPPAIDAPEEIEVSLQHGDLRLTATTRHGLSRLDAGIAERFWTLTARYGPWGLAWMEAVLRLADHRASEMEETP